MIGTKLMTSHGLKTSRKPNLSQPPRPPILPPPKQKQPQLTHHVRRDRVARQDQPPYRQCEHVGSEVPRDQHHVAEEENPLEIQRQYSAPLCRGEWVRVQVLEDHTGGIFAVSSNDQAADYEMTTRSRIPSHPKSPPSSPAHLPITFTILLSIQQQLNSPHTTTKKNKKKVFVFRRQ